MLRDRALTYLRASTLDLAGVSTLDAVPLLSPHLDRPDHLAPYATMLDGALGSDLRVCFSAPPQHGKTVVTLHGLVRWMAQPRTGEPLTFAYATYNQDRAEDVSRQAQAIAAAAGLEPDGRLQGWRVNTGASVKFVGVGGRLTGDPVSGALICDDLVKDREEASSKRYRDRVWNWLTDVAFTRLHPGASAIVMATRWHVDDATGRLTAGDNGWPSVNLQAIYDGSEPDPLGRDIGAALWPTRRPVEWLEQFRSSPVTWASLYQGQPRPAGDAVFEGATFIDEMPSTPHRAAYGVDLAYTARTSADWSVLVEMWRIDRDGGAPPLYVVADVIRRQCPAPEFAAVLRRKHAAQPAPMLWYAAGTEKGSADFIRASGVPLAAEQPRGDKLTRALPVSAAWNEGRILVPKGARWAREFLPIVEGFTGVNDAHDDDVDALAAAYDLLQRRERGRGGFAGVGRSRAAR